MKFRIALALTIAASTSVFTAQANAITLNEDLDLSISTAVVSDYRSMGISQTMGDPALQVDAVLSHSSGAFLELWSSNIDFGTKARREDGYMVGYAYAPTDDFSLSASIGRYEYPKDASLDMTEIYAEANIYKVRLGYSYDYEMAEHTPNSPSYFVGYTFDLPYETSLYLQYGYSDYNFDIYSGDGSTRQGYNDWQVSLTKEMFGVEFGAAYIDTNLSEAECSYITDVDDVCSATVSVSATKHF